jgi:hypothetical protein
MLILDQLEISLKKKSGFIKCVTFSNRFNQLFNPKKEEEDNIKY